MTKGYILRKPTEEEIEELKNYLVKLRGCDDEFINEMLENYWFSVIEDYISDGPGYTGKLLTVIWGCPEFYEVYGWIDDKITKIKLDDAFY